MTKAKKSFKFFVVLLSITGIFVYLLQTALSMDILNVILPIVEAEKGWSVATINGVVSAATMVGLLAPILFGTLIMKWGSKKVLMVAIIITCVATILMGAIPVFSVYVVCTFLVQFITQAVTIALIGIVGNWVLNTKGRVLGVVTMAAPISTAAFTPIATKLSSVVGFDKMYIIIGIFFLIVCVITLALLPEKPEDVGYHLDNNDIAATTEEKEKSKWTVKKILSKKEFWFLILGLGMVYIMMTGIMSQFVNRMVGQGLPIGTTLTLLSIAAILGIPLSYLWGWLDDKFSTPKVAGIFLLTYVVSSLAMIFAGPDNMGAVVLAGCCVAATTGGMPNLIPSCMCWVFGNKEYVNVQRTISTGHLLCRSLSFTLMGAIYAAFGSYTNAYILFILLAIFGAICCFAIRKSFDPLNSSYVGDENV